MEDPKANERLAAADVRAARFPQSRRGYDREAVDAFLEQVADWVEDATAGKGKAGAGLTSEFAKVGERTAGILTAAEDAAAKLRREAKEYAERLRAKVDEEARAARLNASQKADELIAEAEAKTERMIEEAMARRRRLNQAVASLIERREEIAQEAQRLADQLLEAVDTLQADEGTGAEDEEPATDPEADRMFEGEEAEVPEPAAAGVEAGSGRAGGPPTELEPPDQRETAIHRPRDN